MLCTCGLDVMRLGDARHEDSISHRARIQSKRAREMGHEYAVSAWTPFKKAHYPDAFTHLFHNHRRNDRANGAQWWSYSIRTTGAMYAVLSFASQRGSTESQVCAALLLNELLGDDAACTVINMMLSESSQDGRGAWRWRSEESLLIAQLVVNGLPDRFRQHWQVTRDLVAAGVPVVAGEERRIAQFMLQAIMPYALHAWVMKASRYEKVNMKCPEKVAPKDREMKF
jgi:hypothetical protein